MLEEIKKIFKFTLLILVFFVLPKNLVEGAFISLTASVSVVVEGLINNSEVKIVVRDYEDTNNYDETYELVVENGQAVLDLSLFVGGENKYTLHQTDVEGYELNNIICVTDESNNLTEKINNSVLLTLTAFTNTTCTFSNVVTKNKTPVVFIPGILGTEMYKGDEKLWLDVFRLAKTNNDKFMDSLAFDESGIPKQNLLLGEVISKKLGFDYTESLKQDFLVQGYEENKNLFMFPYDWREDIIKIANNELKNKINQILFETKSEKVDIVAHSQGGLVIKRLLYDQPSLKSKIGKLIFLGTPHLGAPKAAKVLLYGDSMGVDFWVLGLDPKELKHIAQNIPAVYQLLPSSEYFSHSAGYLGNFNLISFGKFKKTLLDFPQTVDQLTVSGLNQNLLNKADNFHDFDYDEFDFSNSGISAYNIVGCVSPTLTRMFMGSSGNSRLEYGPGDGTVPIFSASNVLATQNFYFINKNDIHGKMPSIDGVRQKIVNIITGSNLTTTNITNNVSECKFNGQQVSIHSPVDLHIYDAQGNHTGYLPDGNFENNILGVTYDIIGEEKFAFLPAGQIFTIKLVATGSGTFSFNTSIIDNGQITSIAHYDSISISATSTAEVITNSENNQTINFTSDSRVIHPSSVVTGQQVLDVTSPVSTSTIIGTLKTGTEYTGGVNITLSAIDAILEGQESQTSGILSIKYSLNNKSTIIYASSTTVSISDIGNHTLSFYSTDNAGNKENEKSISFSISEKEKEVTNVIVSGGGNIGGGTDYKPASSSVIFNLPATTPQVLGIATTTINIILEKRNLVLDKGVVYFITKNNKRPFATKEEFFSYGFRFIDVKMAEEKEINLPLGSVMKARQGSLVYDVNNKLYLISPLGEKLYFSSTKLASRFGFDLKTAFKLNLKDYLEGNVINNINKEHPNGTVIRKGKEFWWILNNKRHPFVNWSSYVSWGLNENNAVLANKYDMQLELGSEVLELHRALE